MGCKDRLYTIWRGMKSRCYCKSDPNYKKYGAKGIGICEEWNEYEKFKEWAMDNGYNKFALRGQCTIDRINYYGNYEPSNCRWVDMKKQQNNRSSNHFLTYLGETHTIAEWSDITGLDQKMIWRRLYELEWSISDALTKPKRGGRKNDT